MLRVGLLERILNRFDFKLFSNATLTDSCHVFGDSLSGFYDKTRKKNRRFQIRYVITDTFWNHNFEFFPKAVHVIVYEYKLSLSGEGNRLRYVFRRHAYRIKRNILKFNV